jgi:hypothetical protein
MKTLLAVITATMLLTFPVHITKAQESWQQSSSSISGYASTLLLASVVNASYERLFLKSGGHIGFTGGLTMAVQHWSGGLDDAGLGPHMAFTWLSGLGANHFELKLGGALILGHSESRGLEVGYPMPVISLGYRRQAPGSNSFFRCGVSTAGIGVGAGYVF